LFQPIRKNNLQGETRIYVEPRAATIIAHLCEFLDSQSIHPYVVGGYIRDAILKRVTRDIDIIIADNSIKSAKLVANAFGGTFILLDDTHQSARVVLIQERTRFYLDFTAMRGPLENDLEKRDFTLNAIAFRLKQLDIGYNRVNLIDPCKGVNDIMKKVIKATNDIVFIDDPVRLIRAFRFKAELDFSIDRHTESLIRRDRAKITSAAGERVRDEFMRILDTNKSADVLHHLCRVGLLDVIMPELANLKPTQGSEKNSGNILEHSLETIVALERLLISITREENNIMSSKYGERFTRYFGEEIIIGRTRRSLVKLAALLHHTIRAQGEQMKDHKTKMSLVNNERYDTTITNRVLERFHFSAKEKRVVIGNLNQQLRFEYYMQTSEFPEPKMIDRFIRETRRTSIDAIFLGISHQWATHDFQIESGHKRYLDAIDYVMGEWFKNSTEAVIPKLINGQDLIDNFGIMQGPMIGDLLESVQEGYMAGEIETKQDALKYVKTIIKHWGVNNGI
jgi:poly(A) polymerase